MSQLGRMELAALKRMEKSLKPLQNKLEKLDGKLKELFVERKKIAEQHEKMVEVMNTYTGGIPYETILYPEGVVTEEIRGEIDDTEQISMGEITVEKLPLQEEEGESVETNVVESSSNWDIA